MSARSNSTRGFSLIELMCSMAVGTIVLLAAAALLGSSGDGYGRVGGTVASEREARAILTQLSSDLSSARFHKDTKFESQDHAWPSDDLGFLTLQPTEAQSEDGRIGDLCAVNYYLSDLTIGGRTVRCLMRGFRESSETFKALADDRVAPLFTGRDNIDEPVAFGVVSFEATPKSRDQSGKWIDWVENDTRGPDGLDIRLVIARRDLAGRLRQPSDWDGSSGPGKALGQPGEAERNENLQVYRTLIRFGNDENG
jgi:prepilin-type N-terminal cleavage/methylation domain-containing protein